MKTLAPAEVGWRSLHAVRRNENVSRSPNGSTENARVESSASREQRLPGGVFTPKKVSRAGGGPERKTALKMSEDKNLKDE